MRNDATSGEPSPTPSDRGPTEWNEGRHGVGPWEGPWPDDPRYDPVFLAGGDTRNVVDAYRYWSIDAVVADLDRRRHPFHVAIENFENDMNIGTVVRTARAAARGMEPATANPEDIGMTPVQGPLQLERYFAGW